MNIVRIYRLLLYNMTYKTPVLHIYCSLVFLIKTRIIKIQEFASLILGQLPENIISLKFFFFFFYV